MTFLGMTKLIYMTTVRSRGIDRNAVRVLFLSRGSNPFPCIYAHRNQFSYLIRRMCTMTSTKIESKTPCDSHALSKLVEHFNYAHRDQCLKTIHYATSSANDGTWLFSFSFSYNSLKKSFFLFWRWYYLEKIILNSTKKTIYLYFTMWFCHRYTTYLWYNLNYIQN